MLRENTALESISMTTRARYVLYRIGCKTVGDVCRLTDAELLRSGNFGKKSLQEVRRFAPYWPEIEITDAMINAGAEIISEDAHGIVKSWRSADETARHVFIAMIKARDA